MNQVERNSGVFQGGTFAASPLTLVAGITTLDLLREPGFYERLDSVAGRFVDVTRAGFAREHIPFAIDRFGTLASYIFQANRDRNTGFPDVEAQDYGLFRRFHREMTHRGYLFPPTLEEPLFFSSAHSMEDVEGAASAAVDVIAGLLADRYRQRRCPEALAALAV
jgi:glutamate-1-semialdehyde 2,1-aminomutase